MIGLTPDAVPQVQTAAERLELNEVRTSASRVPHYEMAYYIMPLLILDSFFLEPRGVAAERLHFAGTKGPICSARELSY